MRWVIVAHPDDEIIFAGGAILSHADEPWTVVIATRTADSPRAAEALRARDMLRGRGVDIGYRFLGHDDAQFHPSGGIDASALARQLAELGVQDGERVYTHGGPGEYGHNGHKAVHWSVEQVLGHRAVVSTFSGAGPMLECVVDPALLAQKIRVFNQAYPSQQMVWTGIPHTMLEVSRAESHFALATAGATASLQPEIAEAGDDGGRVAGVDALAEALRRQIRLAAGAQDVLVVGLHPAVDLRALQAQTSGRIDVVDPSPAARQVVEDHPDAGIVADDILAWEPGERSYGLIVWAGSLQHLPDLPAALDKTRRLLGPQGQLLFTHEPLIDGHPRQGRGHSLDIVAVYRLPTQAVLDFARRNGMKVRLLKDLVVDDASGQPVIQQLAHLQLR